MLSLVPTPIGNIADISLRALEVFTSAEVMLCEDTRVTKKLFHFLKERYNLVLNDPKFISLHSHNEADFVASLTPDFFNASVVYVSDAGMPGISDPGQLLVRYCIDNALPYDILPGANALLSAFVASGFVQTKMLFLGFLPHKGNDRSSALQEALFNGYTTVLYEAPTRLEKLLCEIAVAAPERAVFLAKEITKKYQRFYHGKAGDLVSQMEKEIRGEWVVVIEASQGRATSLSEQDILALDIPKKAASKLIAKITGENPKECYTRLLNS
ncbi:MAG: 16S rRNA (cytidine(1402)-2'-O)-methyltransferase [Sulfuricurvum sp.]|jgi:16S rRNA (cytidine1402-2'-O)-methyltransferase|uniref:16S rRNA (cytidine(1402)-2'-O)-methyltransferase n=1 Tax=Sulfuricurvum sp. TaxID=2025608 RepID=UPI0025F7B1D0|nr:16S rRNA (cytidine(1402)-2'-O)-methyltransferase [Sulfuricurvum sp.]MCK9374175.1 16S rRNA (cytidine(1402)-2'-O)-methyltransferase [Sulfuricurvum sp.]